jgi:hypothetical protein
MSDESNEQVDTAVKFYTNWLLENFSKAAAASLKDSKPVTVEQMANVGSAYMESLKAQGQIANHTVRPAQKVQEWCIDKRNGAMYTTREILVDKEGNGYLSNKVLIHDFVSKYTGPHRPRRLLREQLKGMIGTVFYPVEVTPVEPLRYFSMTINVGNNAEQPESTSGETS